MALWPACNLGCQFSNEAQVGACKEYAPGWKGDRTLDGSMGSGGIGWLIGLQTLSLTWAQLCVLGEELVVEVLT